MSKVSLEHIFPPIPNVERGRGYNIKTDPKGEKLIYCVANSVFIRDINDPKKCEEITNHAKRATAAAYSPSGFYVCSGDECGTIKIWDTVNPEHAVKYEYKVLGGAVSDISWSDDNRRIVVVGDGRGKYGCVISWDTGTSVGEISGHDKRLLSCDLRKKRPMAIVTAGEDHHVLQFRGPPFKYCCTLDAHTKFVNCVRYSTDGERVASCSQDGSIIIYEALDMEKRFELTDNDKKAHNGGVYAVSWSPDSKYLLSASGDRTCKIWNIEEKKCETVFDMGKSLNDQQLGCLWVNDHLISVSLSGKINFLNKANPEVPLRSFWGHNKSVVCMIADTNLDYLFTSSCEGYVNCWDIKTGDCVLIEGSTFKSQVTTLDAYGDTLGCCGFDDKVRFISIKDKKFKDAPAVPLSTQPQRLIMIKENVAAIGCLSDIAIVADNAVVSTVSTSYEVKGLSVRYGSTGPSYTIAAGGNNKKVTFYKLENNKISIDESISPITIQHDISYLRYSPNGKYLAVCTVSKNLKIYDADTFKLIDEWSGHNNRITCVSWRPDNCYLASCGVDGNMNVWCKDEHYYRIENRNAHRSYSIPSIVWLKDDVVATVSQQGFSIKFWKLQI